MLLMSLCTTDDIDDMEQENSLSNTNFLNPFKDDKLPGAICNFYDFA